MDALVGIGAFFLILLHLVSTNALNLFLITNIFEKDNPNKLRNDSTRVKFQLLNRRRPFKLKHFGCLSKSKSLEKGMKRINDELDIVRFVKQQKYLKVMLETLFSVTELFLIKKNKKLVLRQTESNVESTSDEELKTNSVKIRSRRERYLLENTSKPNRD